MSNCIQCLATCRREDVCCARCQRKNGRKITISVAILISVILFSCYMWVTSVNAIDPFTFKLNVKQSAMVTDCWGNGWDTAFQSDGVGGVEVVCKAAH